MSSLPVMPGLDPGIHADEQLRASLRPRLSMDHRVKPGGDDMGALLMNALFREEVLRHQSQAAIGETMRIVPISYAAFTAFLVGIIALALTYAAFAGYSRKETVEGFITPSRGVVRVVAPRVGAITEVLVKEGELV